MRNSSSRLLSSFTEFSRHDHERRLNSIPGDAAHWPTRPLAHLWQQWGRSRSGVKRTTGCEVPRGPGTKEQQAMRRAAPRPAGADDNERLFSRATILGAMTIVVRESRSTLKKNKWSRHWTFLPFPESCQLRAPAQRPTARRQEFRSVQERTGLSFHRSLTGDLPGVFIGRRAWSARQAVRARSQGVRNARQFPRSRAGRSTRCS